MLSLGMDELAVIIVSLHIPKSINFNYECLYLEIEVLKGVPGGLAVGSKHLSF